MLSHKVVELKLALTVSIFSFCQLGNHRNIVSQRWNWPFRSLGSQVINRITEKKTERQRKQGVKAIVLAAPWSSGKQRACFNIWWVSGLRPGNHNTWTHSGKKYLLLHPESGDLTMLGPFLPCMQKCCVMFPTRNCLMWNMLINYNVTCSQLYRKISALTLGMFCQQMFQILEGMGEVLQLMLQVDVFFLQIVDGVLKLITRAVMWKQN